MAQYIEAYGQTLEFPDGMSDSDMAAAIKKSALTLAKPADKRPPLMRGMQNLAAGVVRGAGSIGATLLTPYDLLAGNTKSIGNPERRAGMDGGMQALGVDTESMLYGGGKLTGEVVGTAGVGGVLARGLSMLPGAARMAPALDALRTAGFSAGGATGKAGIATRTAGGAVAGGASAGLVNPDDTAIGAGLGAALPGAVMLARAGGSVAAGAFRSPETKAAAALLEQLEQDPVAVMRKLQAARELVPGSKPTMAQLLRTPQASAIESIVSDTPGGGLLKARYADQNAARLSALDSVAGVDPRGFRSAQQDFGISALSSIRKGDKSAREATRAAYESVPQDETALYLPNLRAVADELFPRGSYGNRAGVDAALATADDIGTYRYDAIKATTALQQGGQTLSQAVRKAGGISRVNNDGLGGEVRSLAGDVKNIVRVNGGRSPDDMALVMHEAGFIDQPDASTLIDALRTEGRGRPQFSATDSSMERTWAAARDAAMGEPPGAGSIPQKVTLREFDALRKSIGRDARAASINPERATEGLALNRMRDSLDDRINEVVRGDGAMDENLPIAWADALTAAQKLKLEQVRKFRTGPQALAFRKGSDGLPMVQEGEFASKVWGNRPGVAADIRQFKESIADNPRVLGQFKSMITTEGAGTATQAGTVTGKFARWVDSALPGMKEVFSADEVKAFQRIAADIKRAEAAVGAGASKGSSTYRNAAGAMSLGMLDNPLLNVAANRVPLLNQFSGPVLDWFKTSARKSRAESMAGLLADPETAAAAFAGLLGGPASRMSIGGDFLARGLLRTAPAAIAD